MKDCLFTPRLVMRPWSINDAEALFEYAKDPRIGPNAGWEPIKSLGESKEIIRGELTKTINFAVCLRPEEGVEVADPYSLSPIGSVKLLLTHEGNADLKEGEGEICYWVGVPFWGHRIIPEAVAEVQRYAFEVLHLETLWCGYFEGNERSRHVIEDCGFRYGYSIDKEPWEATNEIKAEHDFYITRKMWERLSKAKAHPVPKTV